MGNPFELLPGWLLVLLPAIVVIGGVVLVVMSLRSAIGFFLKACATVTIVVVGWLVVSLVASGVGADGWRSAAGGLAAALLGFLLVDEAVRGHTRDD